MKPDEPDPCNLDWLAFQYLANELGTAERAAFEDSLAENQAAREAVARAVELTQMLSAARDLDEIVVRSSEAPVPASRRSAAWSIPAASVPAVWMGIGAAACLALVAVWSFWSPADDSVSPAVTAKSVKANAKTLELANAWSTARAEFAAQQEALWDYDFPTFESLPVDSQPHGLNDAGDELALGPMPSWMLSAVATEADVPPEPETRDN